MYTCLYGLTMLNAVLLLILMVQFGPLSQLANLAAHGTSTYLSGLEDN